MMPQRRILQVLHSFQIGGSEVFAVELARQFVEQGARVLCGAIDQSPGPLLERCARYGIEVVDLGIAHDSLLGRNGISLRLVRRLRALRLDGIHLQHFLGLNKLGLPARLAGVPRIVVTEHSVFDVAQSRAGRVRARLCWRMADVITVIHQSIKDYLCVELAIPSNRVEVVPIGIDTKIYHRNDRTECRRRLGIEDEMVFAFVGRLAPVKDVVGLIDAFMSVLPQSKRPARLLIVGDGETRGACEALIRLNPLGAQVVMLGEQSDPRPFLAAADVFVLNSRSEGTPRALLEAMAMGIPGICTAVGGVPDLLQGRGWLTRTDDPRTLQAAIKFVLENPDVVAGLDGRCREYVSARFKSQRIAETYWRLLLG